jgi:hypothetical protein
VTDLPEGVRLGRVVKAALRARTDQRKVDLGYADLRGADLCGVDLRGADLCGVDLRGADLGGTDLRGADLGGTDLRGAYLRKANLGGADLRGADLCGVDLRWVVWGDGAKRREDVPVTRAPVMVATDPYDVWIWDRHAEIGCQIHEIGVWAALTEADIERMGGERGVRFWREWRAPLLAMARAAGRPL